MDMRKTNYIDFRQMPGHLKREGGNEMITLFKKIWEKMIDIATTPDRSLVCIPVTSRETEDLMKKEVIRARYEK